MELCNKVVWKEEIGQIQKIFFKPQRCCTIKMLDSLKVVNKQLGSYGCSDHYDLGFNYGKKKTLM